MKKRIIPILALFVLLICLCSCVSTVGKKSIIQEREERMFWEISSPTGTKIYVLGSVHVGNEETAMIPPFVMEAFLSADVRYGELSLEDIMGLEQHLLEAVTTTMVVDENGQNVPIFNLLDEEEFLFLINLFQIYLGEAYSDEVLGALSFLPPWYWNNMLDSIASEVAGYNSALGVDMVLYAKAMETGLNVLGLDTVESQIDLLTFGSTDEQIELLKLKINDLQQDDWDKELNDTMACFLADDKEGLKNLLEGSDQNVHPSSEENNDQYLTSLIDDRNRNWADQFAIMLQEENKTYFVFAGVAHWLYSPTVFELLEQDGLLEWK